MTVSPTSTYRLQLSPDFTFGDLDSIVDYLEQLQIGAVYAAPFFQSKTGSKHGYDVTDPLIINPEIGDLEKFREISRRLRGKGIGWLQDIVPNHMANHPENPWIFDILERGPRSSYYHFFDINWDSKEWTGQVMVPVLGKPLEEVLNDQEIQVQWSSEGFGLTYYENRWPLSDKAYDFLLSENKERFESWMIPSSPGDAGSSQWGKYKSSLIQNVEKNVDLLEEINSILETFNSSRILIEKLLDLQYFKLVFWRESEQKINFRRFFTINDLICLRMEDEVVFDHYHSFILQLCQEGLFSGLRIDHIDGLFDPEGYLKRLKEKVGDHFYVVIEKILEWDEKLPRNWATEGTSGYHFLAVLNNLFTASCNRKDFLTHYQELYPHQDYKDLVFEKKSYLLKERMGGELQNLSDLMLDLQLWKGAEINLKEGERALATFLTAFPVYRIYPDSFPLTESEELILGSAYKEAVRQVPELADALLFLQRLLTGKTNTDAHKALFFLQRCQQFTGPLAAKGVEDTLFYNYNLLISHNEVGDSPDVFGIDAGQFHHLMARRLSDSPLALNATATHDTKRGEDARMRINVLSEIPEEWFRIVEEWHQLNRTIRKSATIPDRNEEYFIYQCLIGAMSFEEEDEDEFLQRTLAFLQKVLREAKVHTSWSEPNQTYEEEVAGFVREILNHEPFRGSFDPFRRRIAFYGAFYSLSQTLIKITAPGVPDVYQGTELWDLSYVDPDNRRPVSFSLRKRYLKELESFPQKIPGKALDAMLGNYPDGRVKMHTLYRALKERKQNQQLFENGKYEKVEVSSPFSTQILSYARHDQGQWYIVAVPTNITALASPFDLRLTGTILKEAFLELPEGAPKEWVHVFTGESFTSDQNLALTQLFASYPVVLLKSKPTEK